MLFSLILAIDLLSGGFPLWWSIVPAESTSKCRFNLRAWCSIRPWAMGDRQMLPRQTANILYEGVGIKNGTQSGPVDISELIVSFQGRLDIF